MAAMNKIVWLTLIVAFCGFSVILANPGNNLLNRNLGEQGSIQGIITTEAGQRLGGAVVHFYDHDGSLLDSALSDADGLFFMSLPSGGYRISAWAEGYVNEYYPNSYFYNNSLLLKLFPKQNIQISISLKRGGLIRGNIATHNSQAGKFTVSAIKLDNPFVNWQFDKMVVIRDNGDYSFGGLLPGHYRIFVRADGYQTQYYPMVHDIEQSAIIPIVDSQIVDGIDFNLIQPANGQISGRVFDIGRNRPVAGAAIFAAQWSPDFDDPGQCIARTDNNGYYQFAGVAGNYIVSAAFDGLQLIDNSVRIYYNGRLSGDLADIVVLESGQILANIDFNLDLGKNYNLHISGSLFDQDGGAPISGARLVALDSQTGKALSSGVSGNTGDFQIANICDGTYLIQITGSNLVPCFWPGVWGWQQAEKIRVNGSSADLYNGGAITQDYGTPGLSISGNVSCPDSNLALARIYAVNTGNDMVAFAKTDNFGNYTLSSGLTEGAYTVFADLYGFDGTYYPGIIAVDLIDNPRVENINFVLIPTSLGIESNSVLPQNDRLLPNYPNPFNGGTNLMFESKSAGKVSIEVYDIAGRLCRAINSAVRPGINGIYWDGRDNFGVSVASGIYFYRVAGTNSARKMSLLK
jgi:hypothetical protein